METDNSDAPADDSDKNRLSPMMVQAAPLPSALPSSIEPPEPPSPGVPALINSTIWRPTNSDIAPGNSIAKKILKVQLKINSKINKNAQK